VTITGHSVLEQKASARGQGIVIQAGRDVIAGDVFAGQYARLRDRWLDPAPVFDDVQVERFTGRTWLLEPLDQFLATHDHGHVIVQADAGLGKTALAAWLAYSRGWPCHFTRGRNGSVSPVALSNLGAQLIAQYALGDQFAPHGFLPDTAGDPGWFEQVLRAAATAARADNSCVVIVADGLDEAEPVAGALPLGLPVLLPRGAFVVATCRTGTDLLALRQPYKVLEIKPRNRRNTADLQRYLQTTLAEDAQIAALLSAAGVTADAVSGRLLKRCGGVWIYMRYVLSELREGLRSVDDIESLPGDLSAFYAESILGDQHGPEWTQLRLPLLATLAVAAEPLPVPVLTSLAGLHDQHPVQVLCGGRLLPFLSATPSEADGLLRYSVYHASLREFLAGAGPLMPTGSGKARAEELARATADAHARIADYHLAAFGGLRLGLPSVATDLSVAQADNGYALRHLAEHLEQSGRAGDVTALLLCEQRSPLQGSVWYAAHEQAGTLSEYRADLDRARRLAAVQTNHDVQLGHQAPTLATELRYLMIDSAVRTLADNVPTELIARLLRSGRWSPARALSYARQVGDPTSRAIALAELLPHLPENERQQAAREATSVARQVPGAYSRAWACSVLADNLQGPTAYGIASEALAATAEVDVAYGEARAILLAKISGQLPNALLHQAARLGLAIAEETARAQALEALVPVLPETILPEVLSAVPDIADGYSRARVVVALASRKTAALSDRLADAARAVPGGGERSWALGKVARATPALAADLAGEALAAARATADPEERAAALSLLTDLPGSGPPDELLEEALVAARSADSADARCRALAVVSRHLPSPHRRSVLSELLKDALACPSGPGQTDRLAVLAPHLTKAMLDKALPGVLAVQPEEDRARLLVAYAPSLPDHLRADSLRAATEIRDEFSRGDVIQALAPVLTGPLLSEALSAAGRISDAYIRSRCVGALADRLPDQLLGQALSLVGSTSSQSGAARFLLGIANRAEEPRRTELLREALAMARSATDAFTRTQALCDISASLNGDEREQVLAEAVRAAKDSTDEWDRVQSLDYLIRRTTAARRKQLIDDAFTTTRAMPHKWWRPCWLAIFARYLPKPERPAVLAEALGDARSLPSEPERLDALSSVAIGFPGDERLDTTRELLAIAGNGERLPAAARMAVKVAKVLPDRMILRALELARKALYEDCRLPDFGWLLKHIPIRILEEAIGSLHVNNSHHAHAIGTAVFYMPAQFRQQALSVALGAQWKVIARRALMTQARLLWQDNVTPAELDAFRRTMTDIQLDDFLNVLAAALDIVDQIAGPQSLDDCLTAFRTIQRWWPSPAAPADSSD
jgi:hypothetical protein